MTFRSGENYEQTNDKKAMVSLVKTNTKENKTMTTFTTQDRQDAQRTPLTDDEVGYFTHQMILCSGQHPAAADINILGLIDIVRAIERAHGIGE